MQKIYISWTKFKHRLKRFSEDYSNKHTCIYGVPKGGMIAAGFLPKDFIITHDPHAATLILDDIVDSGKTERCCRERYPKAEFYPLFSKAEFARGCWIVFPWEADHPAGEDSVEQNLTRVLQYIGEDVTRDGLLKTPYRIVKSWDELYRGYNQNPAELFTTFEKGGYDQMVILKDIEMFSMCEHHMLPFYGKAHVAYIPRKNVAGISKLARLVDIFARRLQIQERICEQVTISLMENLDPLGAACVIEAQHMCMTMRGVSKQNSIMVTSSVKGSFFDDPAVREEFMNLIK